MPQGDGDNVSLTYARWDIQIGNPSGIIRVNDDLNL